MFYDNVIYFQFHGGLASSMCSDVNLNYTLTKQGIFKVNFLMVCCEKK